MDELKKNEFDFGDRLHFSAIEMMEIYKAIQRNSEEFIARVSKQPADVEELERLYRL